MIQDDKVMNPRDDPGQRAAYILTLADLENKKIAILDYLRACNGAIEAVDGVLRSLPRLPNRESMP